MEVFILGASPCTGTKLGYWASDGSILLEFNVAVMMSYVRRHVPHHVQLGATVPTTARWENGRRRLPDRNQCCPPCRGRSWLGNSCVHDRRDMGDRSWNVRSPCLGSQSPTSRYAPSSQRYLARHQYCVYIGKIAYSPPLYPTSRPSTDQTLLGYAEIGSFAKHKFPRPQRQQRGYGEERHRGEARIPEAHRSKRNGSNVMFADPGEW